MHKSDETFSLIYPQNIEFISGNILQPVEEQEICKNIGYRLGVPYPYSIYKKAIYGCVASVTAGLVGIFAFLAMYMILSGYAIGSQIFVFLFVGTVFFIIASVIIYLVVNMLKAPPNIVEETYQSMVEQHNIVYGKIETIEQSRNATVIHYVIDSYDNNFTYLTKNFGVQVKLNSRIYILYLNDKIHAIL